MKKNEEPIVVEQVFDRPASDIWRAVTDIGEMRQWYFENIPDFVPDIGFYTEFPVDSGERIFLHQWRVTEVETGSKIVYSWNYRDIPGDAFVTFEVSGDEKSSRLTVTTRVVEDFPDDVPEFEIQSCRAGWEYFINERLRNYLDDKCGLPSADCLLDPASTNH